MNKKVILTITMLLTVLLHSFEPALANDLGINPQASYVLPLSLQTIEDEAFLGTTTNAVVFPEGFLQIGDNAFFDAHLLTDVYVPDTTRKIADSAFMATTNLTIHGIEGSCAEEWSEQHGVMFVADDVWNAIVQYENSEDLKSNQIGHYIETINPDKVISINERGIDEGISKRPQDRFELNPIDYRFP